MQRTSTAATFYRFLSFYLSLSLYLACHTRYTHRVRPSLFLLRSLTLHFSLGSPLSFTPTSSSFSISPSFSLASQLVGLSGSTEYQWGDAAGVTQGRTRRSDPPSPAYIRKIKPSQAVLNALGLHAAAVPPPLPTSSSTSAFTTALSRATIHIQVPFSDREPPPPTFSTSCGVTARRQRQRQPSSSRCLAGTHSFTPCSVHVYAFVCPTSPILKRTAAAAAAAAATATAIRRTLYYTESFLQKYHEPPRLLAAMRYRSAVFIPFERPSGKKTISE